LVIAVAAAGYGRVLDAGEAVGTVGGRGYLIQNASLVLTMDPNLGDRSILGQLENGDVLIVGDQIGHGSDFLKPGKERRSVFGNKLLDPRECFYKRSSHLAPVRSKFFTFAEAMPIVHAVGLSAATDE
jgi:hypothetical protein